MQHTFDINSMAVSLASVHHRNRNSGRGTAFHGINHRREAIAHLWSSTSVAPPAAI